MTLYTIIPEEMIFEDQPEMRQNLFEIQLGGIPVQVEHDGGQSLRIERILSTDPADFLHHHIQPGKTIPLFYS
ncbi:YlzJ-like family protein [Bacillus massiliglaciei]|uniref:YlzJ-like family protein n=1 Tax=Bacillus massiliglaciei TaxID=1816693 RepID=UPI000DA606F8|nr:YlzJ-like family protein [Bacillus massiliglaciei]